jgi:hypothetical protein
MNRSGNASPYADLTLVDGGVFVRVTQRWRGRGDTEAAPAALRYVAAECAAADHRPARTRDVERVELRSEHLDLTVSALDQAAVGTAIGRDARGLLPKWTGSASAAGSTGSRRSSRTGERGEAGRWSSEQPLGVDGYGLFAEISVAGVSQRFRWIAWAFPDGFATRKRAGARG